MGSPTPGLASFPGQVTNVQDLGTRLHRGAVHIVAAGLPVKGQWVSSNSAQTARLR